MGRKTKDLLNVLKYWCPSAFNWDFVKKGKFTVLKLMDDRGFIKLTDIESVLKNWQKIENKGAVAPE